MKSKEILLRRHSECRLGRSFTLLFYTLLSHIILYYTLLSHIILYYTVLNHTVPYYPILYYAILYFMMRLLVSNSTSLALLTFFTFILFVFSMLLYAFPPLTFVSLLTIYSFYILLLLSRNAYCIAL